MAGPWEKYASQVEDGPWSKYAATSAPSNNPADYPQGKTLAEAERMRREFVRKDKENASLIERMPDIVQENIPSRRTLANLARPTLEAGGAVLGGLTGAAGGAAAGLGVGSIPGATVGAIGGAGLGYSMGSRLADLFEGNNPETISEGLTRSAKDIATGMTYEMGGQAVIPALSALGRATSSTVGKGTKQLLGRISGTGTVPVEEAIQSGMKSTSVNPFASSNAYDKALRGQTTGEEIVDAARNALNRVKDARSAAYQSKLAEVDAVQGPLNIQPITNKIYDLAAKYNVKIDPATLQTDTSRVAMGKTGRKDIEDIMDTLVSWGRQPEDMTAKGLDTLKRQLDDFYSDSSQARQFVSSLRDTVRQTIADQVPAYDKMTKGYSEATKLIKDVEADLMLRKQGMSGRITADKTLRRLMSSMRDNFEMRKELVDILGKEGGEDLMGMLAGYSQSSYLPRGLAGVGPSIISGAAIAKYVDPWFATVLAASSPRVQGEFLRMWGRGLKTAGKVANKVASKVPATAIKPAAIGIATTAEGEQQ